MSQYKYHHHFSKFSGLRVTSKHGKLTNKYIEKMIVREPQLKQKNMHPEAMKRWNTMMQEPKPLTYKLHEWPVEEARAKIEAMQRLREARIETGEVERMP